MKKLLTKLSAAKCVFILLVLLLLSVTIIGTSTSSYITTATQKGTISTVTPYVLNGEIRISFFIESKSESVSDYTDSSTGTLKGALYTKSQYFDDTNYIMLENSTNLTDYYENDVTNSNIDSFVEGYTDMRSSKGALTYDSTTYNYSMLFENTVGEQNDNNTTLSIAPFTTQVKMTVYTGIRKKDIDNNKFSDVFELNGTVITKSEFTAGTETFSNAGDNDSHLLYTYTKTLSAGEACNFVVSSTNVVMYLIVFEEVTPLQFTASGAVTTSTTLTGNATETVTVGLASGSGQTISAVTAKSSNTGVAEVSAVANAGVKSKFKLSGYALTADETGGTDDGTVTLNSNYQCLITPKGAGTATITFTVTTTSTEDSSQKTYIKTYSVTVEDSLTVKDSSENATATTIASGGTVELTPSLAWATENITYTAESSDTDVATAEVSDGKIKVTGASLGTAAITITAAVKESADEDAETLYTCTTDYTIYVDGYYVAAEGGATTVTVDDTLTLALYQMQSGVAAAITSGVEWSIDSSDYASIEAGESGTAVLKGTAAGTVTVTATYDGVGYNLSIEVKEKVTSTTITFTSDGVSVNPTGLTVTANTPSGSSSSGYYEKLNSSGYITVSGLNASEVTIIIYVTSSSAATSVKITYYEGEGTEAKTTTITDMTTKTEASYTVTLIMETNNITSFTIAKGDGEGQVSQVDVSYK